MLKKLLLISAIVLLFSLPVWAGEAKDVTDIRQLYAEVDERVDSRELLEVSVNFQALEVDGILTISFYADLETGDLALVSYCRTSGNVLIFEEYLYSPDGKLALVYHRVSEEKKVVEEESFYFKKDKLIKYIGANQEIEKDFPQWLLKSSSEKVKQAKVLQEKFVEVVELGGF